MDWLAFLRDWPLHAARQGFQTETLVGVGNLPVYASSKNLPHLPTIYLSAGIHGDEPAGPFALLELLQQGTFDHRFHWLICPALNPTGLINGTRENHQGHDLNRDYFKCQTVEVCAHLHWLQKQPTPGLCLSLHEDWETTGFYYYEINLQTSPSPPPSPENFIAAAAPHFPPEPSPVIDDHPVSQPGWIYHPAEPDLPDGWPEAIYLAKNGCPLSLTFETPSTAPLPNRIACQQALIKQALNQLTPKP